VFTRRFRNAVDAEVLALRRSKAFLLQHLGAYFLLVMPIYSVLLAVIALLVEFSRKIVPITAARVVAIPVGAAIWCILSDNALRAAAALMAVDEQVRVRKFVSFRVFWKLILLLPRMVVTQAAALVTIGPGWVIGDCLWPVVCVVEKLSGKAAVQRSRELMTGLRFAGRSLAIRHLALAAFAVADVVRSVGFAWEGASFSHTNEVVMATWFPLFALYAAAPLFLYDRTAANPSGPLLQLDRTPEVRTTARAFSISSIVWLAAWAIYLLYQPVKIWLDRGH
jgi:hypothetical protein